MGVPVEIHGEWRDVVGYEGIYRVSDQGQVYSFITNKNLRPNITKRGYCTVELFKDRRSKRLLVHRLAATAFLPNPDCLPQVNHKDENPKNNRIDNLEWVTAQQNMTYNGAHLRRAKIINYAKTIERARYHQFGACNPRAKAVHQYTMDGVFLQEFPTAADAVRALDVSSNHISECCRGHRRSAHGYTWKYKIESGD